MTDFHLPYLTDYAQPVAEDIAIFCVAMLTAILVSAEGQGFVATLLGDARPNPKDRMHFNVFLHMSILGTLSFFVAGFGWAKEIDIDAANFKKPRLFFVLSRISGPVANLLLANIASSINWILSRYGAEDKVFATIVVVNVTMAIYGLLPIPPLPGSSLILALLPKNAFCQKAKKYLPHLGGLALICTFLVIRFYGWTGISALLTPLVVAVTKVVMIV